MEIWRRSGQGRLAELFGKDVVDSDIYMRTLGIARVAEQEHEASPDWMKIALESYAAGVNAYIGDRKPGQLSFEFILLSVNGVDIEIDPWLPVDSLTWAKVMGLQMSYDMRHELSRLDTVRQVGVQQAGDIYVPSRHTGTPTTIQDEELPVTSLPLEKNSDSAAWLEESLNGLDLDTISEQVRNSPFLAGMELAHSLGLGSGEALGSNAWVVSGDFTASGKPILSSDPHFGIQMPAIFYEVSLHYTNPDGDAVNIHGFSFAGVPGVVIGHNDHLAWGITTAQIDSQDLYVEKINPLNPDQYLVEDKWVEMEMRTERVKVEGKKDPVFIRIRSTRNGPIVTDHGGMATRGGFDVRPMELFPADMELTAMSLKFTGLEKSTTLESLLRSNEAASVQEFRRALELFDDPSVNFFIATTSGDIAYQLAANVPLRKNGTGALPAPGWDDEYQRDGYVPFDELPYVINPSRGYVVNANNALASELYPYYISRTFTRGYRAKRITELLTSAMSARSLTVEDMMRIQTDIYNYSAVEILDVLFSIPTSEIQTVLEPELELLAKETEEEEPDESKGAGGGDEDTEETEIEKRVTAAEKGLEALADWDYLMDRDSYQAALFAEFYFELISRLFSDDLRPDTTDFRAVGIASRTQSSIARLLDEPENPFWDDRWTLEHGETRDNILMQALSGAYRNLEKDLGKKTEEWKWSDRHSTTFRNMTLGDSGITIIENLFNRGPYLTSGGLNQVAMANVLQRYPKKVSHISAMRMITDLSDWSLARYTNSTGQSGHIKSKHYDDAIEDWVEYTYSTRPWSPEEINDRAKRRLVLRPGGG